MQRNCPASLNKAQDVIFIAAAWIAIVLGVGAFWGVIFWTAFAG